jgi:hypothetical protein
MIISGIVRRGGNVAPSGEKIHAYRFSYINLKDRYRLEEIRGSVIIRINIF